MDNQENNTNPEPTQVEEIVEVEEIVQTEQPLFAKPPADPSAPQKPKKKIGKIIAICLAAVLLISGGAFATIYMAWRNSDPIVILDAVTNSIKQTKSALTGTIDIAFNQEYQAETSLKAINISLDSAADGTSGANANYNGKFSITSIDDKTTDIAIGGAIISEGVLYIKIDGITAALDAIDLPADAATIVQLYLSDLIETIDGEWYKITAADLNLDTEAQASYNCVFDALNEVVKSESLNEYADLYKKYPFLISNKNTGKDSKGNTIYNVSWDSDLLTDYMNSVNDTTALKSLSSCIEDYSTDETTEIDPSDLAMPENFPGVNLHISDSRKISGISFDHSKDGNSLKANLSFDYGNTVKVEIPENAKSVSDLMSSLEGAFNNYVIAATKEQGIAFCASYAGTAYYNQCLAAFDAQIQDYLENMDFSDLLQLSTGATPSEV